MSVTSFVKSLLKGLNVKVNTVKSRWLSDVSKHTITIILNNLKSHPLIAEYKSGKIDKPTLIHKIVHSSEYISECDKIKNVFDSKELLTDKLISSNLIGVKDFIVIFCKIDIDN